MACSTMADGLGFLRSRPVSRIEAQDGGRAPTGERADLDRPRRDRLRPCTVEVADQPQDAEAAAEPLLGVRPACQDRDDEPLGVRADRRRPAAEAVGRPFGVAAVRARHVVGGRGVAGTPGEGRNSAARGPRRAGRGGRSRPSARWRAGRPAHGSARAARSRRSSRARRDRRARPGRAATRRTRTGSPAARRVPHVRSSRRDGGGSPRPAS